MNRTAVKIKSIKQLNHDVLRIVTEKPNHYHFKVGQATDIAINKEDWKDETRPFTFTNLPTDNHLEFMIKMYPSHNGVTEQLSKLKAGDEFTVGEVYGAIQYKGKGTFLAGGAGITPFIAIMKFLDQKNEIEGNSLIFANKTKKDIFLKEKFESFLGQNYLNILSEEETEKYPNGLIDFEFLKKMVTNFSQYFYVCGPPKMTDSVINTLLELGVDSENIVAENFDG